MHASLSLSIKIFILALLTLVSCGEEEATKAPVPKPIKKTTPEIVPSPKPPLYETPANSSSISVLDICGPLLKQRDGSTLTLNADGVAVVEIDTQRVFTNESLVEWGLETARIVFSDTRCTLEKISFSAKTKDGLVYQGLLKRQDFKLHQSHKISSAELSRRFEIRQMATLPYIKVSLKKARLDGDIKQAETWLDQWLEKEPGSVPARLVKGNLALEKKQYADAIAFYDDVLRTAPDNIFALYNRAFAKKSTSRFGDAITDLEHIFKLQPNSFLISEATARLMLADCYLAENKLKEALMNLEMVRDKTELDYLLVKANILRADKKFDQAIAVLDGAKNFSGVDTVLFNRILLDLDKRDAIAARVRMVQLQEVNPKLAGELDFLAPFHEPVTEIEASTQKKLQPLVPESETNASEDDGGNSED